MNGIFGERSLHSRWCRPINSSATDGNLNPFIFAMGGIEFAFIWRLHVLQIYTLTFSLAKHFFEALFTGILQFIMLEILFYFFCRTPCN